MSDIEASRDTTADRASPDSGSMFLLGAWALATASVLGSLFFSEVMELPPCSLCWYQRCFMFPLALILLVGVLRSDKRCVVYALPCAAGGWLLAAYHVLLHTGVIPEDVSPCQQGVSCSEIQLEFFGFISIPVMSLVSFTAVAVLLMLTKRSKT